jgi:hypothetical protein
VGFVVHKSVFDNQEFSVSHSFRGTLDGYATGCSAAQELFFPCDYAVMATVACPVRSVVGVAVPTLWVVSCGWIYKTLSRMVCGEKTRLALTCNGSGIQVLPRRRMRPP